MMIAPEFATRTAECSDPVAEAEPGVCAARARCREPRLEPTITLESSDIYWPASGSWAPPSCFMSEHGTGDQALVILGEPPEMRRLARAYPQRASGDGVPSLG
jgi:hypothetical protein